MRRLLLIAAMTGFLAIPASAATFVMPTDDELETRSEAIVIGVVEGSYVEEVERGLQTVYELRVRRGVKGTLKVDELIRVVSPGGFLPERGLMVPGAAHFESGERVLLFLTRQDARWTVTDFTLGKFRFVQSTRGERLLVRDLEDVVGWDRSGQAHQERLRRETEFLRFLERRVGRRVAEEDYFVDSKDVTLEQDDSGFAISANQTSFPPGTYTDNISSQPIRWPNAAAGVTFRKRSTTNISGLADGGAGVIQNGLAAWANDCGSTANLIYGGTTSTASANHDGVNVVEFNDPQGRISGSWSGSGTIAITFQSFAGSHSFAGRTWWNITDADVVFQDGYPGTHATFAAAMTHELGHAIGWRHSNASHVRTSSGADQPCNAGIEECSSHAIMFSSVIASLGYNLQTWDINAVRSVYPGGTCGPTCSPASITIQPSSTTINAGGSATLSVAASGTTPLSYQWYVGQSGSTGSPIAGATSSSISVSPASTTSYWVRVSNGCGTVNSATVTVTVLAPPTGQRAVRHDFDGDGRSDILWRNSVTGEAAIWLMDGFTLRAGSYITSQPLRRVIAGVGDFDGDGRADILWRDTQTGENIIHLMNGFSVKAAGAIRSENLAWRVVGIGDFNGDGRDDILWRNFNNGDNAIWLMNGFNFTGSYIHHDVLSWTVAGVGDFNGDGRADILWRNSAGQNAMWLMNGFTLASGSYIRSESSIFDVAGVGDFNGDGRADILWRNRNNGDNAIWLMNGFTLQSGSYIPREILAWAVAAVGDYNGDGRSDILWRDRDGNNAIWLMNGFTLASGSYIRYEILSWQPVR
ncbi:MAG TPA: FG-GAP-like repeat-containing protein [Thermoanaerobaculia bacterium]